MKDEGFRPPTSDLWRKCAAHRQQNLRNHYSLTSIPADAWSTMWCRVCGQDVPGIPSLEDGKYACARCGESVSPVSPESPTAQEAVNQPDGDPQPAIAEMTAQHPPFYNSWELGEQLRHLRWILGTGPQVADRSDDASDDRVFRLDGAHDLPGPHEQRPRRSSKKPSHAAVETQTRAPGDRPRAVLAWTTLLLGTAGFIAGLVLTDWPLTLGQKDLGPIGGPLILAGQIILILGLVLQLDRTWRDGRWAAAKLRTVDEEIHDLKTTTELLGTGHGPSGQFYAHWAGGAGPEVLLGDLKGQLDLLAVKLAEK